MAKQGHVTIVERLREHAKGFPAGSWGRACATDAAEEIERLQRELSTARRTALLEARRQAFDEAGLKAREYAAHYPEASDGRNTFIIFAEWAEGRP